MARLIDLFLHLDRHLNQWAGDLGPWLYLVLFLIVFCETGLVVTPFLPGDSLLFAVGALAAAPESPIHLGLAGALLFVAAVAGDAVNYSIGARMGPRVFAREDSRLLSRKHLIRSQQFYERHGGKTILLARFVPIVRTFAPFVAGVGRMGYRRFALFNVAGALIWIALFLLGGYYFGNLPFIQRNFHYAIIGIVVVSMLPLLVEFLRSRAASKRQGSPGVKE